MSTADVSGIDYHEMAWIGYRADTDDMATIMALLPTKCLSVLRSRLDEKEDRTLEEIGIIDVDMKLKYGKEQYNRVWNHKELTMSTSLIQAIPMRPRSDAIDVQGSPQVQGILHSSR